MALSLGGNQGDPQQWFRLVLSELRYYTRELRVAPLYRTSPLSPIPQDDFLNTAVLGRTWLGAEELLAVVKGLELRAGRRPGPRFAPRPLDVDLLLYGELRIRSPELVLPHPGLRDRRFVLRPLADLAAQLRLPGEESSIAELLAALPSDAGRVQPVPWSPPGPPKPQG